MFGYLRFILALLVVISHLNIRFYTLNTGVIAVVVFYILAGFVVSHIYTDIIPHGKTKIITFYKDRILRIFPLYLYIIMLTILFLLVTSFGASHFTPFNIVTNLTIIPLNYYMIIDNTILTDPNWWLIPPAWSLGTELQAYLLLPFALIFRRVKFFLALFSFIIYSIANFSIINPDYFGYRLVVGVFFIFLLGVSIQKVSSKTHTAFDKPFILAVWSTILLFVPLFIYLDTFSPTYTKETFIGLLFGVPLVYTIAHSSIKLPFNRVMGSLSYGLFLSHFLAIWLVEYFNIAFDIPLYSSIQIIAISLAIAFSGLLLIEVKITKILI